ncbi:hypothetical protein EX30DRAFT_49466 [Ascodesmis nigricans]|uniref:DUF676 domain-containing protein n=1 Tax=Ascodesmis nigricans TaxID=341454 RepID=A0A4S2MVR3_9PEZI|nr:hypothetical protein EX30DRAFT_49466 [Ascodesmis nigricans]
MSKRPLIPDASSSTTCASRPTHILKASHEQPFVERSTSLQRAAYSSACPHSGTTTLPASTERSVPVCFRISDIPLEWDCQRTLNFLAENCSTEHATTCQLSLYPSTTGRSQVGILELTGPRDYINAFAPLSHDNPKRLVTSRDHQVTIDRHFYGLTPLNTISSEVIADVVAITGLSGHAYESWRHRESSKMWLKDFLPDDLKRRARIMTFGYNTSLTTPSMTTAGMVDFVLDLIQQLKAARQSAINRSLILVGHNLGCIIITKALLICKLLKQYKHLLKATRLLVFFGAPHHGLRTKELEEMVDDLQLPGSDRFRELLMQIRENSKYLEEHAHVLGDIWRDRKIISLHELHPSPTVKKDLETGRWGRDGESLLMVQNVSSLLFLPNEERISVASNHSEMTKFLTRSDTTYGKLVGYMEEALDLCSIELKDRKNVCI